MMTDEPHNSSWHLSKTVPISVIFAILFQTAAILIWAVRIDARVSVLEIVDIAHATRIVRLEDAMFRIALLEERQRVVIETLTKNGEKMDRLLAK